MEGKGEEGRKGVEEERGRERKTASSWALGMDVLGSLIAGGFMRKYRRRVVSLQVLTLFTACVVCY